MVWSQGRGSAFYSVKASSKSRKLLDRQVCTRGVAVHRDPVLPGPLWMLISGGSHPGPLLPLAFPCPLHSPRGEFLVSGGSGPLRCECTPLCCRTVGSGATGRGGGSGLQETVAPNVSALPLGAPGGWRTSTVPLLCLPKVVST